MFYVYNEKYYIKLLVETDMQILKQIFKEIFDSDVTFAPLFVCSLKY